MSLLFTGVALLSFSFVKSQGELVRNIINVASLFPIHLTRGAQQEGGGGGGGGLKSRTLALLGHY